mgnify:CR=1 FL=1
MKVKNLIKAMKYLNQDEEIIVMWWERDTVKRWVGREVTDNEWANAEEELMTHDWQVAFPKHYFSHTYRQPNCHFLLKLTASSPIQLQEK